MTQQVKDLVLLLLWHRYDPWPQERTHAMGLTKKKKERKKKGERL